MRRRLFGIDEHADADPRAQKFKLRVIFGVAHARDEIAGAERFRHDATEDVVLVLRHDGNEHIASFNARFPQDVRTAPLAAHPLYVEAVDALLQDRRVALDRNDVVSFAAKLFGQGNAYPAHSDDDNFHKYLNEVFYPNAV